MRRTSWIVALIALLALASSAAAQDGLTPQAAPAFASLYLNADFTLDPYLVRVESSGALDAAAMGEDCVGVVSAAPDVVVNWTGETEHLTFFVYSDTDPVLLIVTPSGEVLCNDDWDEPSLSPVISVPNPAEGAYAVYVGAYSPDHPAYGWLGVTQLPAEALNLPAVDLSPMLRLRAPGTAAPLEIRPASDLLSEEIPIFGSAALDAGFGVLEASVSGAGVVPAQSFALGEIACAGYINLAPSFVFNLEEASATLSVLFNGDADAALIVRLPDESFVCNADAAADNLNPQVRLEGAPAGDYAVWVGVMSPDSVVPGTLIISEDAAAQPALLAAGQ